jgi:hypothetical protein
MQLEGKIPFDTIMTSLLSYSTDLPLVHLPESVETDQTWYHAVYQYLKRPMIGYIETTLYLVPHGVTISLDTVFLNYRDWKLENDPFLAEIFREDITVSSLHPHFLQVCFDLVEHKIYREFQDYLREISSASM